MEMSTFRSNLNIPPMEEITSTTNLTKSAADDEGFNDIYGRPESREANRSDLDDAGRLRMLGYDAVLGRPLGFWGSTAMNICQLSCVYEYVSNTVIYGYPGALLFIIGYPCAFVLHLILLGPFAEFASAYPVSGALATWSWRSARAGVRYERQWGWIVSGVILAAHVGKVIASMYVVTLSWMQLYVLMTNTQHDMTGSALHELKWWKPVFQASIISVVAILTLTRVARTSAFWIGACVFNLALMAVLAVLMFMCAAKTWHLPRHVGYPTNSTWTHSVAYMLFVGLPFKVQPLDCPAHMAEETENPARTVPRAMYTSVIIHFVVTYVMTVLYILFVVPEAGALASISPMEPIIQILKLKRPVVYFLSCWAILGICTQLLSSVIITSRFIFSLARDCGIPFSNLLVKTSSNKEPWVADLAIIGAMYASVSGWFVNKSHLYNLVVCFGWWFISVAYIFPLVLYLFSRLDLQNERTEFTLRQWSKPSAAVAVAWLLVTIVQGSLPISIWNNMVRHGLKVDTISCFPMVVVGILLVMFITWWLYGRRQYVGPIRGLTKWLAGVEINPHDYATSAGRATAIKAYMTRHTGKESSNPKRPVTPLKTRAPPKMMSAPLRVDAGDYLLTVGVSSLEERAPEPMPKRPLPKRPKRPSVDFQLTRNEPDFQLTPNEPDFLLTRNEPDFQLSRNEPDFLLTRNDNEPAEYMYPALEESVLDPSQTISRFDTSYRPSDLAVPEPTFAAARRGSHTDSTASMHPAPVESTLDRSRGFTNGSNRPRSPPPSYWQR